MAAPDRAGFTWLTFELGTVGNTLMKTKARRVLVIDVGGGRVKMSVSGSKRICAFKSGSTLTPVRLVDKVLHAAAGWRFDVISLGYPGVVIDGVIVCDPKNLGVGWTGFDFAAALKAPVKIVNDAVMQALGSYHGGRMLFMGLGTGIGTVLISDDVIYPMELAHRPFTKRGRYGTYLGDRSLRRLGVKPWRRRVRQVVRDMAALLQAEYIVIGGGNAKRMTALPRNAGLGHNNLAFEGGYRLWHPVMRRSHAATP